MKTIVTLTMNPAIDTSSGIDYVVAERKLRCKPARHEPGGGGINVSRAIRNLGGESLALYTSGGPTGTMFQDLIDAEDLDHRPIAIGDSTRQNFIVLEESTDRQYRFGMPGPALKESEWKKVLYELSNLDPKPDYIVLSGSLPPGVPGDFYARAARMGKDEGSQIIVDTSGEALRLTLKEGVYLLKPNIRELRELAGSELRDESEQEAAAIQLVESGQSEVVVVSLGAAGVMMVSSDGCERFRAPTVPIKSKVGAGDSTVAGMVLSLARGKSLIESVRFGVASGAAAVMTPGTELCRKEDAERLYERMLSASHSSKSVEQ